MGAKTLSLAALCVLAGLVVGTLAASGQAQERTPPAMCTYETYQWSTEQRRGVNRREVEHPYSEVTDDERDPNDARCTVCREDQALVDPSALGIEGVDVFRVCWAHRDAVERALRSIAASGEFEIVELDGYRPGRTRGRVVEGLRTEWSNHSYGTALDVNASDNGLYNDCDVDELTVESIAGCRLSVGGAWNPERRPRRTVVRDGVVYRAFVEGAGWRWGGDLTGRMRDLMHFSLTGE